MQIDQRNYRNMDFGQKIIDETMKPDENLPALASGKHQTSMNSSAWCFPEANAGKFLELKKGRPKCNLIRGIVLFQ